MPSLFEYHFKKSLQQAVTQLSLDCQKSDGSDHQKDFNTKVQIRLMNETLAII